MSAFGQKLRHFRLTRGQMPTNIANLMHCRPKTIENLENGTKKPTRQIIRRLSVCLDLSPVEEFELLALAGTLPPDFFCELANGTPIVFTILAILDHQGVMAEDKDWLVRQLQESTDYVVRQYGLDRNPADEPDIVIPIEPTISKEEMEVDERHNLPTNE